MSLPTSLIKVVSLGSLHCALSLFVYFCYMSGLSRYVAGDLNQKIPFVGGVLSISFARALFRLFRQNPSWVILCQIKHVCLSSYHHSKFMSYMSDFDDYPFSLPPGFLKIFLHY